ncbi:uncharacterized protein LOC130726059 [Lotus japonicus]|uniref:uncharacterized protein LOC130726059 n=1 Tax=Lotus japonicus TaxID=34305 RepID=UPI0025896D15|nr:uncharacterized protein LOC130726059 [Lotus japonicus]
MKNQESTSNHLSRSMKQKHHHHHLLLRLVLAPFIHKLFSLSSTEEKEPSFSLEQIPIAMPNKETISYNMVSNSCSNGLVCLYSDFHCGREIALCNPTTRDVKFLPISNLVTEVKDGMVLGVGMGHDYYKIDDYKVVRMWISYLECRCKKYIVEEYCLSTKSWRIIDSANPYCCDFEASCFAMHFDGFYFWWAKLQDSSPVVVALDVGGGYFRKVHLPKRADIGSESGRYLGVLNGFVSLVCRDDRHSNNDNLDIWVIDGAVFNSCTSWTKLRTLNLAPCTPLTFWKGKELLVKMFDMLKSYDVESGEIHHVSTDVGGQGIADICQAIPCVKSLASI